MLFVFLAIVCVALATRAAFPPIQPSGRMISATDGHEPDQRPLVSQTTSCAAFAEIRTIRHERYRR
jgi:hypothetical protein